MRDKYEDRLVRLSGQLADVIQGFPTQVGDTVVINGEKSRVTSLTWYSDKAWDEYEDENGNLASTMIDCPGSWIAEMTIETSSVKDDMA